jgi:hypothetical protein
LILVNTLKKILTPTVVKISNSHTHGRINYPPTSRMFTCVSHLCRRLLDFYYGHIPARQSFLLASQPHTTRENKKNSLNKFNNEHDAIDGRSRLEFRSQFVMIIDPKGYPSVLFIHSHAGVRIM